MARTKRKVGISPTASAIVGSWRLLSCEHVRADGVIEYPFGKTPSGRLVYSENGRMIVLITDPSRPRARSAQFFETSPYELASAARGCVAYSGTWELRGTSVIHTVEQSLFPNWERSGLVRTAKLLGKRLTLSTAAFSIAGTQYTAALVWVREP